MNIQDGVERFRATLLDKKKVLLEKIQKEESGTNFGSDVDSYDEEADEAEELGNQLAVAHSLRKQLTQIESALNKITEKTYGTCENCHKKIEEAVLIVVPESRLCEACKLAEKDSQNDKRR